LVGCLAQSSAIGADNIKVGDPIPDRIVENWHSRQSRTSTLYCEFEWRRMIAPGQLNLPDTPVEKFGPLPKKEQWLENKYRVWLDFDHPRARAEYDGLMFSSDADVMDFHRILRIGLCDGERLQIFEPADGNDDPRNRKYRAELSERIADGRYQVLFFDPVCHPVFFGQGIVAGPDVGITPATMRTPIKKDHYKVAAVGGGEGTEVVTLRSIAFGGGNQFLEFDVDLGRDCAITRKSWYVDDGLRREYRVEPAETERGWMPNAWTVTIFNLDGTIGESWECKILEREFDPNLSSVAFHVEPEPGEFYWDERTGKSYLKSAAGDPDVEARTAIILMENQGEWWRRYAVAGGLIALIAFLLLAWRRQTAA
jgi:hypothetical protein